MTQQGLPLAGEIIGSALEPIARGWARAHGTTLTRIEVGRDLFGPCEVAVFADGRSRTEADLREWCAR